MAVELSNQCEALGISPRYFSHVAEQRVKWYKTAPQVTNGATGGLASQKQRRVPSKETLWRVKRSTPSSQRAVIDPATFLSDAGGRLDPLSQYPAKHQLLLNGHGRRAAGRFWRENAIEKGALAPFRYPRPSQRDQRADPSAVRPITRQTDATKTMASMDVVNSRQGQFPSLPMVEERRRLLCAQQSRQKVVNARRGRWNDNRPTTPGLYGQSIDGSPRRKQETPSEAARLSLSYQQPLTDSSHPKLQDLLKADQRKKHKRENGSERNKQKASFSLPNINQRKVCSESETDRISTRSRSVNAPSLPDISPNNISKPVSPKRSKTISRRPGDPSRSATGGQIVVSNVEMNAGNTTDDNRAEESDMDSNKTHSERHKSESSDEFSRVLGHESQLSDYSMYGAKHDTSHRSRYENDNINKRPPAGSEADNYVQVGSSSIRNGDKARSVKDMTTRHRKRMYGSDETHLTSSMRTWADRLNSEAEVINVECYHIFARKSLPKPSSTKVSHILSKLDEDFPKECAGDDSANVPDCIPQSKVKDAKTIRKAWINNPKTQERDIEDITLDSQTHRCRQTLQDTELS